MYPFIFTSESKREAVGNLRVLCDEGRLKIAAGDFDPHYTRALKELIDEVRNYEVRIEDEGGEKYGVFKTGKHDDLVTALMLAVQDSYERPPYRPTILFVNRYTGETHGLICGKPVVTGPTRGFGVPTSIPKENVKQCTICGYEYDKTKHARCPNCKGVFRPGLCR